MTIAEAIKKELRAAERAETEAAEWEAVRLSYIIKGGNDYNTIPICEKNIKSCKDKAADHRQYAEWFEKLMLCMEVNANDE